MTETFDPLDEAQLADPFPTYRALREHEPAQRIEVGGGTWVVSRYDDVKPLIRNVEGLMRPPGAESPRSSRAGRPSGSTAA
jgi:cytochrome P450